jgi:hypothetical protein
VELAVDVRHADFIQVHERERADTGAGEGFRSPSPDAAKADDTDMRSAKSFKAVATVESLDAAEAVGKIAHVAAEIIRCGGFAKSWLSETIHHLSEAVVYSHAPVMAEELFTPFLDAHGRFLLLANDKLKNLADGFIDEAAGLNDGFLVNADDQRAAQLVEIEFDGVFLFLSNFQFEFHGVAFVTTSICLIAISVPRGGNICDNSTSSEIQMTHRTVSKALTVCVSWNPTFQPRS